MGIRRHRAVQGDHVTQSGRVSIASIWGALTLFSIHLYVDINRSHEDVLAHSSRLATSYSRLVAEHALATFDRAGLVLEQAVRLPVPADQAQGIALSDTRRAALTESLLALQAKGPGIVSMSITNRDGTVYANTVGTPPGGYLGDRGYFLALKNNPADGPVVSEVIKGRISNKWGIQIARSIPAVDGSFGGMVVANIGMTDYMERFYGELALGSNSVVSLRDTNHRLLVRYPAQQGEYGKVVPSEEIEDIFASGDNSGWIIRRSPIDNIERIVAVYKLPRYNIYAVVGLTTEDLFKTWSESRDRSLLILFIALFSSTVATIFFHRKSRAERELRNQRSFQDALFDTLPIPVFARDLDGRFMTCNKAYERYFGIARKSLIGKSPRDIFPFTLARTYIATDHEVLENRQAKTYETKVIRADGTTRRAVTDKTCYLDAAGEPAGIVGTLVDVTDKILIAEELAAARDSAEEALATERLIRSEQRNFLTMISHEFRVPLAIIEGSTQLLGMYCDNSDEARDEEAKIFRAVRRMTDLIDVFLADDRLDSASLNIITRPCDITSMIRELCQEMEEFSGAPRISLSLEPGVDIVADATLLKVAFTNIINNAIKFSTPDSEITVTLYRENSTVTLTVMDSGPGISQDDAIRVFEKFFRSTSTNRVGGAGLGLYIVKRIIDLHFGSIVIDSPPGQGCTVRISLPLNSA